MASLIEAIDVKRKMFFEFENAPYHCIDVEISKPTARGGQTLVRIKMRNLLTRAVFDRTFKAGDKFASPISKPSRPPFLYADQRSGYHFMDQDDVRHAHARARRSSATIATLLVDNVAIQIQKYNGTPIGLQFPPHVELTRDRRRSRASEATRRAAASPSSATLETGLEIRVPALHQGRRAGEGPHGDARVRRTSVKKTRQSAARKATRSALSCADKPMLKRSL